MDRQLAPLEIVAAVGNAVAHHVDDVAATGEQDALLAIGREDHVAAVDRHRAGHGHRLFAGRLHVEAHLALALQLQHAFVIDAGQHHVAQPFTQDPGIQLGIPLADRLMIVVEHADEAEREISGLHSRHRRVGPLGLAGRRNVDMGKIRRITGPHMRRRDVEAGFSVCHGLSLKTSAGCAT